MQADEDRIVDCAAGAMLAPQLRVFKELGMTRGTWFALCAAVLCSVVWTETSYAARRKQNIHKTPPDLINGGKPDDTRDWRLGPIGANGWVFSRRMRSGASRDARQIAKSAPRMLKKLKMRDDTQLKKTIEAIENGDSRELKSIKRYLNAVDRSK